MKIKTFSSQSNNQTIFFADKNYSVIHKIISYFSVVFFRVYCYVWLGHVCVCGKRKEAGGISPFYYYNCYHCSLIVLYITIIESTMFSLESGWVVKEGCPAIISHSISFPFINLGSHHDPK